MSKKISAIILSFILALSIAGCSTGNNNESGTDNGSTASPGERPNATGGLPVIGGGELKYDPNVQVNEGKDTTLTFWSTPNFYDFYVQATAEYSNIHPNVKIDVVNIAGNDYNTKIAVALQGSGAPDLLFIHNSMNQLVPHLAAYPVEVLPYETLKKDFRQVEQHEVDGKLYYIDMGIMTSGIFYSKAAFEEAGLTEADIPETWEELVQIAKKLTKYDNSGKVVRAGFNYNEEFQYLLGAMNAQSGIWFFGEDGQSANLNHPEVLEHAQWLKNLYDLEKVGSNLLPTMRESFGSGKAAMVYSWGWFGGYNKVNFPDFEYGFFKLPHFEGQEPVAYDRNNGEASPAVSKNSKNQAVAFDFIKFLLANDDLLVKFDLLNSNAPSKYVLDKHPDILNDQVVKVQTEVLDKSIWVGPVPSIWEQDMKKYLEQDFLINNVPLQNAIDNATKMINKDIKDTGFVSIERKYFEFADDMKK